MFPREVHFLEIHMTHETDKSRMAKEIDENLRRAFDDISNQGVPDRFVELLSALKQAEQGSSKGASNDK